MNHLVTPLRGVPWAKFRPPRPRPREDYPGDHSEAVPTGRFVPHFKPVGLPWQGLHVRLVPTHEVTPPTPPVGTDADPLPLAPGPPIRAPWNVRTRIANPPAGHVVPPPPPTTPDPVPASVSGQPPLIAPWPQVEQRGRRTIAGLVNAVNALITAGWLVQTDLDEFELSVPGLPAGGGISGTFSSGTFGGG